MKHYKLLKDLPTFKAGDEFELTKQGNLVFVRGTQEVEEGLIAYSSYTLEKFPNILEDWFEEMPDEHKRWRAEKGELYHFVNDCGRLDIYDEACRIIDDFRYNTGNYFKTKEETKTHKEYLLARQVLLDDAEGGRFIRGNENWYVSYDVMGLGLSWTYNYSPSRIYFKDKKSLKKSIEKHKEQWEIVRRYEMGE